MSLLIDSDTHLFEPSDMWQNYIDPKDRDVALHMATDDLGYTWLMYGDRRLSLGGPHRPGDVDGIGVFRQRLVDGLPSNFNLSEFNCSYSNPVERLAQLDKAGFDASIMFPNYGISWERPLQNDLRATLANMAAWNRWIVEIAAQGEGRLFPVAHLSLQNLDWLEVQLEGLADGGIRLGLIAPALVNGKPLSHHDLDRAWAAFIDHDISPVFHVANQTRPFDDAWYGEDLEGGINPMSVVFIWTAAALALSDLILNGVLERFPDLRIGIMELSAPWVSLHLRMMDGGYRHTGRFNGESTGLSLMPSEYFRRQVRVAAFSYEQPHSLIKASGDIFMACSDYPHTEGTYSAIQDYEATGLAPSEESAAFFGGNAAYLLRLPTGWTFRTASRREAPRRQTLNGPMKREAV
ncbi:MAG TPA: amidohydrolase family protein [Acidimicrobiales bacterium]|nr:amidohydrolase family protein [Acidimicrobiales bacterium]